MPRNYEVTGNKIDYDSACTDCPWRATSATLGIEWRSINFQEIADIVMVRCTYHQPITANLEGDQPWTGPNL
jgi:hypothetical protein